MTQNAVRSPKEAQAYEAVTRVLPASEVPSTRWNCAKSDFGSLVLHVAQELADEQGSWAKNHVASVNLVVLTPWQDAGLAECP